MHFKSIPWFKRHAGLPPTIFTVKEIVGRLQTRGHEGQWLGFRTSIAHSGVAYHALPFIYMAEVPCTSNFHNFNRGALVGRLHVRGPEGQYLGFKTIDLHPFC